MSESRRSGERLLTIEEAAERLGVTPRMIRRLTTSRRLPFVEVGAWCAFAKLTSRSASTSGPCQPSNGRGRRER